MSKLYYRPLLNRLCGSTVFTEASREELRVLLAVTALGGRCADEGEISQLAECSLSRCKAALLLFMEEGLLEKSEEPFADSVIEYEYKGASHFSDTEEEAPLAVASTIRSENLSELIDECAAIMSKSAFSTTETAKLVSLVKGLSLSGEYITTLLSFLNRSGMCTVTRLVKKAEELVGKGIDSYETLEEYIRDRELPDYVWEYRRVFGIFGRSISKTEGELYKKWSEEYGYSVEIVAAAYDKAVLAGSASSVHYIDAVLTAWHEAGCKTVAQCEANSRAFKDSKISAKAEKQTARPSKKTQPPTPRYGDFDVEEAFKLALERSYGEDKK